MFLIFCDEVHFSDCYFAEQIMKAIYIFSSFVAIKRFLFLNSNTYLSKTSCCIFQTIFVFKYNRFNADFIILSGP